MHNKKISILEILKTFSKNELKEFEKFIKSPYFIKNLKVSPNALFKLYKELLKYYPHFDENKLNKRNLFEKIYPESVYKDEIMRNLISALVRLAEDYMSYSLFKNDEFERKKYLLLNLNKHKLDKLFERHEKNVSGLIEQNKTNTDYFINKHIFQTIINDFCKVRRKPYDMQVEVNTFFCYYLAKSLELYRNMAIDEYNQNENFDFIFLDNVMSHLKDNSELLNSYPMLSILYYELMLVLYPEETYYQKLKKLKDTYVETLDILSQYSIYVCLSNFCVKMKNEGKKEYYMESFDLNEEILNRNIHRLTPYIPLYFFL
ncbi:MAG TPA: hypothetical protein VGK25_13555, partial [Ignavibacteria bacterium]